MTQSTDTTSLQEQIEEAVERLDSLIAEEIKRASDSEQQLMGKPISMGTGRELHLRLEKLFKKELSTIASKSAEVVQDKRIEIKKIVGTNAVFLLPSNTERVEGFYKNNQYRVKGIDVTKDIQEALKQHTTEEVE